MAWHWDQAVRPWHGACGRRLVFVGCPSKRPYHVRQGRRRQPDSRESRERSWVGVWGVRVNKVSTTWCRSRRQRAQSATHKDRPFLLAV
jgi:hypothetical protein